LFFHVDLFWEGSSIAVQTESKKLNAITPLSEMLFSFVLEKSSSAAQTES